MFEIAGGILLAIGFVVLFIVMLPVIVAILRGVGMLLLVVLILGAFGLLGWLSYVLTMAALTAEWRSVPETIVAIAIIAAIGFWPWIKPKFYRH
jgi:hypothetical protein